MTKLDQNLLYLQVENARIGLKEISQLLQKSSQRLKYSIAVLEREKVLEKPFCIFDYSYFGLILFRVYYRGSYASEQEKIQLIEGLKNNPYIISICEFTGEFDLGIEFASPNPSKFNKELKNLSRILPALKDYKIVLNLVTYVCPRHYLTKSERLLSLYNEKIIGGDREREQFSANDLIVIKTLLEHPLSKFTKLAQFSGLNAKTVKSIYKSLVDRRIIKGFSQILDTNKLGLQKCRLFLKLHNLSQEREAELTKSVLGLKEVVQINKTVGDWDWEIELESSDRNRTRFIIMDLRERYKEIIEKFNIIDIYNYNQKSYLPKYLFEGEK